MSRVAVARSRAILPRAAAALSSSSTAAPSSSRAAAAASTAGAAKAKAASGSSDGAGGGAPPAARKRRGLLKFGALAAFAGALGGAGYVSYAYTLDEVDQKTREFRKNLTPPPVPEDASGFEKFQAMAYSKAMKVPVAAIELYLDIRTTIEDHVKGFTEPTSDKLLPDLHPQEQHIFTLVLDLNETLVYSDWQRERGWRTFKRPGVDAFVEQMAKCYEVVVYSDQMPMYVEPVMERLDSKGYIASRLSRPATKYQDGKHYRDLSRLNRNPAQVLYISGHALEHCLQSENCLTIKPWKLENDDTQLLDLIPFLEYVAMARPPDIRTVIASYQGHDIATEFVKRSKELERRTQQQKQHRSIWRP